MLRRPQATRTGTWSQSLSVTAYLDLPECTARNPTAKHSRGRAQLLANHPGCASGQCHPVTALQGWVCRVPLACGGWGQARLHRGTVQETPAPRTTSSTACPRPDPAQPGSWSQDERHLQRANCKEQTAFSNILNHWRICNRFAL